VIKIELNIEAIKELVEKHFRNKLTYLANELEIDYSYLNQIMNGKRVATSKKVCKGIIKYCVNNGLDYQKYVSVPFGKKFDSTNLSMIRSRNNQIKSCITKVQNQINEVLEYVNCMDELIRKAGDDSVESL
jgi:hypothetical protein